MRTEMEIKNLILDFAKQDDRIRAILLNGSRADPNTKPDQLQDFDVLLIVEDLESFTNNHNWTNFLGGKIISQLPDEMVIGRDVNQVPISFHYLMLFKDGNRIDLTLFPRKKLESHFRPESLAIVWLDKDNLFSTIPPASDKDYHIKKPSAKEFSDTCNEFWWVCTYVAKGLLRDEITYAKHMAEIIVRPMLMKMIEWKIGVENSFSVSFGTGGKFMKKYITDDLYKELLKTYSNSEIEENWKSLFVMTEFFRGLSNEVAQNLNFQIDTSEQTNTIEYLKQKYDGQKR